MESYPLPPSLCVISKMMHLSLSVLSELESWRPQQFRDKIGPFFSFSFLNSTPYFPYMSWMMLSEYSHYSDFEQAICHQSSVSLQIKILQLWNPGLNFRAKLLKDWPGWKNDCFKVQIEVHCSSLHIHHHMLRMEQGWRCAGHYS